MEDITKDKKWHTRKIDETMAAFNVTRDGLSEEEVKIRQAKYGKNELEQKNKRTVFQVILDQFKDVMILILLGAAILSIVFGIIKCFQQQDGWTTEIAEGCVIFVIILINGAIGTIQEIKASNALDALKKIGAPTARVIRNGQTVVIPTTEIVLGDVVYIEDGSIVPADLRLIESSNLKIQEASLTGESLPVSKEASKIFEDELAVADRKNMCYSSSIVTYGNGIGIVVAIGMNTEVGKIAKMLNEQEMTESPIKVKLNKVGKLLSIVGAISAAIVLIIGFATLGDWTEFKWLEPLMVAIALAVAVIPEGLPATATIVMALGVQRMAKKNAIVRRLPVVETLGSATVICSDKTGTLTLNRMTVTNVLNMDDILAENIKEVKYANDNVSAYRDILDVCLLCNNAEINEGNKDIGTGDPTEVALLNLGPSFDISYKEMKKQHTRLLEQPFDSVRKRMSTINIFDDKKYILTKGAAEELIKKCEFIKDKNGIRKIQDSDIKAVEKMILLMSQKALRVLGYAKTELEVPHIDINQNYEENLVFIGLTGMIDPPRKEVMNAIQTCHTAGIKTVMITGDHKITAQVIASELGIYQPGNTIISGDELDAMSDEQLAKSVVNTTVFARVSPEAKLRIVKALQANNEVTAMTGDGVNDAPALKRADIGVAMGITGTDVAKDASDMILLDDNFTTIEGAIFEGRRIYRNIQKVIQYLLAGNVAEILIVLTVFILSAFMPNTFEEVLNPIQLLCINLITDTIPCLALGLDPAEKDIMEQKARVGNALFGKGLIVRIIWHGFYLFLISLVAYCLGDFVFGNNGVLQGDSDFNGMTLAFLTIAISQVFHSFNQRSDNISIFSRQNPSNRLLPVLALLSFTIVIILAMISMYTKANSILGMNAMGIMGWVSVLLLSVSVIPVVEISKLLKRKWPNKFKNI